MNQKTYRFRRFLATAIDWNLAGLPALIGTLILLPLADKSWMAIIVTPLIIAFPILFLHRDQLFKGRSPGNRLVKLVVLNRRTLQPLTGKALVTRNLFFLLGGLDLLVLLVSGTTLGDRTVGALVVPEDQIPAEPPQRTRPTFKSALKVVLILVLCITLFIGIVQLSLNSVKDEPHYALAHSYLVNSEAFRQLEAEEADIRLNGYSRNTTTRNGVTETKAVFTFQVKGYTLTVTCHENNTGWYVCQDCTRFQ